MHWEEVRLFKSSEPSVGWEWRRRWAGETWLIWFHGRCRKSFFRRCKTQVAQDSWLSAHGTQSSAFAGCFRLPPPSHLTHFFTSLSPYKHSMLSLLTAASQACHLITNTWVVRRKPKGTVNVWVCTDNSSPKCCFPPATSSHGCQTRWALLGSSHLLTLSSLQDIHWQFVHTAGEKWVNDTRCSPKACTCHFSSVYHPVLKPTTF